MRTETTAGFRLLWLNSARLPEVADLVAAGKIDGVGLNPHAEWDGTPADFEQLPTGLRALGVPFADLVGFAPAHLARWPALEFLWISESKQRWEIVSPTLRVCWLGFDRAIHFGETPALQRISAFRLTKRWTLENMPKAPGLTDFLVNQGSCVNLDCLGGYRRLQVLELANLRGLQSISAITGLSSLERLRIESCKNIQGIEEVIASLPNLHTLELIDCGVLPSLAFIQGLPLRQLLFGRTVIADGNLAVLDDIQTVAFNNKPHYNRKSPDFPGQVLPKR